MEESKQIHFGTGEDPGTDAKIFGTLHYLPSCGGTYNIVDQIFIANADYLGSNGNAGNTVVFPLTVVALAVAVMIGDGCCAFVSISLGSGKRTCKQKRRQCGSPFSCDGSRFNSCIFHFHGSSAYNVRRKCQ